MGDVPFVTCALLLCSGTFVSSFNFAPEYAQIFSDPSNETRSYFGFSVALRRPTHGSGARIVVGAPRAKPWNSSDATLRPGRVYECSSGKRNSCVGLFTELSGVKYYNVDSNMEDGNLGFTVDVEHNSNVIVACSPTWKDEKSCHYTRMFKVPSRPNGICYVTSEENDASRTYLKIHLLTECDYQLKDNYYNFAYGEFGVSMQVIQNFSEIVVGAPGVLEWKGAVLRYNLASRSISCTCESATNVKENSYLGYSTSYGKFTSTGGISYVASAPRGARNKGKVFVFNFENNWTVLKEREGTQFGEYFGASLCVGDFNNDGLDDLLVGAPQHSIKENAGDEGCVYILINTENGWKDLGKKGMIFGSQKIGARFGTAVSLLGDINMDGFVDVAVGAPYENKRGAIYIYHGSKEGVGNVFSQRITPSESSNILGFGYSISRGIDVDRNEVNDAAVGAYISGHVVLLKAHRVVTIIPKLIPPNEEIPFAAHSFERELCLSYLERYKTLSLEVEVSVKVDQHYKRAFFNASKLTHSLLLNMTVNGTKPTCRKLSLIITKQTEFSNPIEFHMDYKIIHPVSKYYHESTMIGGRESSDFCESCVIRNPLKPTNIKWEVPYVPDSTPADLNVKAYFINVTSPYVIGSTNSITFTVKLTNTNERAIDPKISVHVPLKLLKIPPACQSRDIQSGNVNEYGDITELICNAPSPFPKGKEFSINFSLSTSAMPYGKDKLKIHVKTYSRSRDRELSDNTASLDLHLRRSFKLEIHGNSEEYEVISHENTKDNKEQEEIRHKLYKHNFKVINYGPSPATDLNLFVEIPHKVMFLGVPIEVLSLLEYAAYLEEQPLRCVPNANMSKIDYTAIPASEETQLPLNRTFILSCSSPDVQCTKIKCAIGNLDAIGYRMHISFILKIITRKLGIIMNTKDIILIKTYGHIFSPYNVHAEVHSVVWTTMQDTSLDMGILAMSIGFGCLILLICLLLLIKLGFFRRQDAMERYYRKKTALAMQSNNIPTSRFYSQRGSIMVF